MSVTEAQARIKSRVWQAVAQGELDVSGIDKQTLEQLVDYLSEVALLEIDAAISDSLSDAEAAELDVVLQDGDEDVLWEGRPFLSLVLKYRITDERILITEGLLSKQTENIELIRIQDMSYKQSFSERLINVGDIIVRSHDSNNPTFQLRNVKNPGEVHEILRRAVLAARKRHNFTYREEM